MNVCVCFWSYQQVKTGETNRDMDTECLAEAKAKPVAKRLETDRGGDSTTKNGKLTNITNNILMETLMYLMATWWQIILWTKPCNRTCSTWAAHGSEFDLAFIYIYIYLFMAMSFLTQVSWSRLASANQIKVMLCHAHSSAFFHGMSTWLQHITFFAPTPFRVPTNDIFKFPGSFCPWQWQTQSWKSTAFVTWSVLCWSCMRWSLECKNSFTSWPSYTRIFLNSYRSVRIPSPVQFKPINVLSNIWHRTRGKCAAGSAQMSPFCKKRNQQHWRARSLIWSRHEVTHRFTLTFAVVGSSE